MRHRQSIPAAADSLQRCADYYAAYYIPFDTTTGFDERQAYASNPDWAKLFRVQRQHLSRWTVNTLATIPRMPAIS